MRKQKKKQSNNQALKPLDLKNLKEDKGKLSQHK